MKIKLTQAGWQTYSGHLSGALFVDGVADDVTKRQAALIGNILLCETEDGKNPSDSQAVLDSQGTPMGIPEPQSPAPAAAAPAARIYTRQELEQLADQGGIEGLRAIAPEGVKGRSIVELITKILDVQNAASEYAKAVQLEPTPTVVHASWPFPASLRDGVTE